MNKTLEAFWADFQVVAGKGIGRQMGRGRPAFQFEAFESYEWAPDRATAEALQSDDDLGDFLLMLRPPAEFSDREARSRYESALNKVADEIRPKIDDFLVNVTVCGITNESVGFGFPHVLAGLRSVGIYAAQERFARAHYGVDDVMPANELLGVYESGHILCGYHADTGNIVLY